MAVSTGHVVMYTVTGSFMTNMLSMLFLTTISLSEDNWRKNNYKSFILPYAIHSK